MSHGAPTFRGQEMDKEQPRRVQKEQPKSEGGSGASAVSWKPRETSVLKKPPSPMLLRGGVRPASLPQPISPQLSPIGIPCG